MILIIIIQSLLDLPDETIHDILSFLSLDNLDNILSCSRVSKQIHGLCEPLIYRQIKFPYNFDLIDAHPFFELVPNNLGHVSDSDKLDHEEGKGEEERSGDTDLRNVTGWESKSRYLKKLILETHDLSHCERMKLKENCLLDNIRILHFNLKRGSRIIPSIHYDLKHVNNQISTSLRSSSSSLSSSTSTSTSPCRLFDCKTAQLTKINVLDKLIIQNEFSETLFIDCIFTQIIKSLNLDFGENLNFSNGCKVNKLIFKVKQTDYGKRHSSDFWGRSNKTSFTEYDANDNEILIPQRPIDELNMIEEHEDNVFYQTLKQLVWLFEFEELSSASISTNSIQIGDGHIDNQYQNIREKIKSQYQNPREITNEGFGMLSHFININIPLETKIIIVNTAYFKSGKSEKDINTWRKFANITCRGKLRTYLQLDLQENKYKTRYKNNIYLNELDYINRRMNNVEFPTIEEYLDKGNWLDEF
ncbi:uncharacterized protein L201_001809 [Kwoniella dendrophila CBS 6074]|uniref:F-box domain-containing protein n=1 Tax=Kwoniella dendrophila CBS 6074 TaxID=1295534 RepID=A0AAX4JPW2_9TREE